MKYKVGDKVRIKSLDWYTSNKNKFGKVWTESLDGESQICFDSDMILYCGMETVIFSVERENYVLKGIPYAWTDEMIEGLVEEEDLIPKFGEYCDNEPLDVPTMTTDFVKKHGLPCPEDYIFKDENGNVINAQKIVLEKKKKEYPKTYEECCEILEDVADCSLSCFACGVLNNLQKLLLCRDAYWKLYGEEMGLGKPWEPDWEDTSIKYCIERDFDVIKKNVSNHRGYTFAFPTKEMRDAFYENFKELIESCKELL